MVSFRFKRIIVVATLLATPVASAQDSAAVFGEAGWVPRGGVHTGVVSVGYIRPLHWPRVGGSFSSHGEMFASAWRSRYQSKHKDYLQVGAIVTLRYRFAGGQSPWFADAGAGATLFNHIYRTHDREFSTAFQFTQVFGLGVGVERHEVALRLQHVSNAGIRKPNPGENLVRLRYSYRF